ncbi:TetR/AcrR family transcriptional regulator [Fervidibacillus halotolerans]|uniref:TetR/AcrR family transcriptional regulator n=1 Tax=Fervidibacillus halotolerans TaxID=2980027 RepID=A0A9E8M0I9_9BACI|nr:TetR/AcrR family transcriptional regulator [Fervidibacillus halotolerans]WAA13122.1 TetR/AcrR family transcriptional regulator [Fervidibacillus halotolerans]
MNHSLMEEIVKYSKKTKTTDKKQRVLQAAAQLFAEKGYANTSTSEIAKKADVAEGTIFRHFQTKEKLLRSILLPFLKESLPPLSEDVFSEMLASYGDSPESFFRALIKNRYEFFKESKEYFQILVKEFVYTEPFQQEVKVLFEQNVLKRINDAIKRFQEKGEITQSIPSEILTRTAFTIIFGFFFTHMFLQNNEDTPIDNEIEQVVQIIINGMK